jgi:DNA-binding beta-propeller fold protein YncE
MFATARTSFIGKRYVVLLAAVVAVLGLASGAAMASTGPGPLTGHGGWAHGSTGRVARRFAFEHSSRHGGLGHTSGTAAPTGNSPQASALDNATQTLYVANVNDGTLSIINAATCNAFVTSGCSQAAPTVQVGNQPAAVSVNQATTGSWTPRAAQTHRWAPMGARSPLTSRHSSTSSTPQV